MTQEEWAKMNEDHSRLRARQRYGINLTKRDYIRMNKAIRNMYKQKIYKGISVAFRGRLSNSKSVWNIVYKNTCLIAIYNGISHNIQTFLPKNYGDLDIRMWAIANNRKY